ncbi:MAG: hypothetical protein ACSHX0_02910 [Akkermansiaceae bacterium]
MEKLSLITLSLLSAFFVSCSSTPLKRIDKNPIIYKQLSEEHQSLVRAGQITEGMTKPAVFLAKGPADKEIVRVKNNKRIEQWDYTVLSPVYHSGFSSYFGSGWGRRYRNDYWGLGYSPSVHYVARLGNSVYFENGKVSGYKTVRN